jgi:uncharacterized membrane protein YGL010W
MMPALDKYMAQYDHEHTNVWNKILHGVGIPIIIVGMVLAILTYWKLGLVLFVAGWVLLLAGHRIEGNKPAFFQGLIYFLVGPIWVAKEIKDAILGTSHRSTAAHRRRVEPELVSSDRGDLIALKKPRIVP